jgi:excinuclease ABC subunit A
MPFPGILADIEHSFRDTDSEGFQARLSTFMVAALPECGGSRLNKRSAAVRIGPPGEEKGFPGFMAMDIAAAHAFAGGLVARSAPSEALARSSSGSSSGSGSSSTRGSAT